MRKPIRILVLFWAVCLAACCQCIAGEGPLMVEDPWPPYTSEENLKYLVDGRVDFIIESRHVAQGILEHHPDWAGRVYEMDIDLETYDYYMGISRKSKYASRIKDINKAIFEMKSDGTMDRLVGAAKAR